VILTVYARFLYSLLYFIASRTVDGHEQLAMLREPSRLPTPLCSTNGITGVAAYIPIGRASYSNLVHHLSLEQSHLLSMPSLANGSRFLWKMGTQAKYAYRLPGGSSSSPHPSQCRLSMETRGSLISLVDVVDIQGDVSIKSDFRIVLRLP
jgi:hypothetical protein